MNKILRLTLAGLFAVLCGTINAQTVIDFDNDYKTLFPTLSGVSSGSGATAVHDGDFTVATTSTAVNGVTVTVSPKASNNPNENRIWYASPRLRMYSGTLTVKSENPMTSIEFVCAKSSPKFNLTASTGTLNDKTWTGAATEVVFTCGGNTQICSMTVTVQAGGEIKKSADLAFDPQKIEIEKGTAFTAPTFTKATTAAVEFSSDNEAVATVSKDGVISLGLEEGTAVITATAAENAEYYSGKATCTIDVFSYNTYKKATSVESGKEYLLVAQRDNKTYYAYPLKSNYTYGALSVGTVNELTDVVKVKTKYKDGFIFTTEGAGYSIKDVDTNRYLIQKGTYTTFNVDDVPTAWNVEKQADGTFKIEMNGYYIQWGEGTRTTFGVYTSAQNNAVMPYLYVLDNSASGINRPTIDSVDENAPIYNLAGQRVSKNTKGILIQNGKKFINK